MACHRSTQAHPTSGQHAHQRGCYRPSSISSRGSNRRSQPTCGTCVTRRTCQTQNLTTSARLDAKPQETESTRSFTAPAPPDAQLFLSVDMIQLLVVHEHSFAFQQNTNPAITEPTPHSGNRLHLFAKFCIVQRPITPDGLKINTDKPARTALRDIMIPHCLASCSPSHIRCRQFFPSKSFRTTLSNMVSASRRLSFEFSFSRDFRRWASDISCLRIWL